MTFLIEKIERCNDGFCDEQEQQELEILGVGIYDLKLSNVADKK